MSKPVLCEGSVRVDLLGGTLDLPPINLILNQVVTLNVATSLKASVKITPIDFYGVEIVSLDYKTTTRFQKSDFNSKNFSHGFFGQLNFVAHLLDIFSLNEGICLELASGSPPGAGLGGSSSMGVTLYRAICEYKKLSFDRLKAIREVAAIEAKILDMGQTGYQDYYPALFGGVLALVPKLGSVSVDQLYTDELKNFLETHLTLAYSGETRLSGINNWEVYKAFFNKDPKVRFGLSKIAELSQSAYIAIKANKLSNLTELIAAEGEERKNLFGNILTPNMVSFHQAIANHSDKKLGMKICGAGGGGCFLVVHDQNSSKLVEDILTEFKMQKLPFCVERPL